METTPAFDAYVRHITQTYSSLLSARFIGLSRSEDPHDEVDAPEYARMPFRMVGDPERPESPRLLNEQVMFPVARSPWGCLTHILLFDAHDCFLQALRVSAPVAMSSRVRALGASPVFTAGAIEFDVGHTWMAYPR